MPCSAPPVPEPSHLRLLCLPCQGLGPAAGSIRTLPWTLGERAWRFHLHAVSQVLVGQCLAHTWPLCRRVSELNPSWPEATSDT